MRKRKTFTAADVRRARREALREAAHLAEAFLHITPREGGDELDRIARYSNGTVCRIADAIRRAALKGGGR